MRSRYCAVILYVPSENIPLLISAVTENVPPISGIAVNS